MTGDNKGTINGRQADWDGGSIPFKFGLVQPIPLEFRGPALLIFLPYEGTVFCDGCTVVNITLANAPGVHILHVGQPTRAVP